MSPQKQEYFVFSLCEKIAFTVWYIKTPLGFGLSSTSIKEKKSINKKQLTTLLKWMTVYRIK